MPPGEDAFDSDRADEEAADIAAERIRSGAAGEKEDGAAALARLGIGSRPKTSSSAPALGPPPGRSGRASCKSMAPRCFPPTARGSSAVAVPPNRSIDRGAGRPFDELRAGRRS